MTCYFSFQDPNIHKLSFMWSVPFLRVLLVEHTSPLSPSSLPGCLFAVLSQGCPLHLIQPRQAAPPGLWLRGGAGDSHHMADRSPAASPGAMRKLTPDHSSERESERESKTKMYRHKLYHYLEKELQIFNIMICWIFFQFIQCIYLSQIRIDFGKIQEIHKIAFEW